MVSIREGFLEEALSEQDLKDKQEFILIHKPLTVRGDCPLFCSSGRVKARKGPYDSKSMHLFTHTQ